MIVSRESSDSDIRVFVNGSDDDVDWPSQCPNQTVAKFSDSERVATVEWRAATVSTQPPASADGTTPPPLVKPAGNSVEMTAGGLLKLVDSEGHSTLEYQGEVVQVRFDPVLPAKAPTTP
jgi:hypothetical protein